jgi:hypothetical protein
VTVAGTGPILDHLWRLTDERGLFEHARDADPRAEHGYCVDDAARALLVVCGEPDLDPELLPYVRGYLDFTTSAIQPDGTCHNRMRSDGRWSDVPGLGDWWGRALWGLGSASVHGPTAAIRATALLGFRQAARQRSPHLRAMVFAALGAGEVLLRRPEEYAARALLRDAVTRMGVGHGDPDWPWPEARLAYANGSIVEAMLLAGTALPDQAARARGLRLLDFLLRIETRGDHLSVTPVSGRGPLDTGPGFDQQPIELAALAGACTVAYEMTDAERWLRGVRMAWRWFEGANDSATPMFDPATGGGFDGLQSTGRNNNQGAESTLAMLHTAQYARRLGVLR